MNTTIEKLRRVRAHDAEVKRRYELQPRQKIMPFRVWLRKNSLGEAVEGNAVVDSLLMTLPRAAADAEKQHQPNNSPRL